ncbi:MAG: GLPGLI family protein [Saprospiraceae bacterium]
MEKIIILCFFLLQGLLSNAQSVADYTIYYDFTFITDTANHTFSSPEEFMLLRIGKESRFAASARYYNDSTRAVFSELYPEPDFKSQEDMQKYANLFLEKVTPKPVRSDFKIIKNFETGNFISIRMHSMVPMQYLEEPMALAWEMTNESDTIQGLPCMKATTKYGGRNYNAWFTLAVPINDGPYVFQGLPGLILKVTDDKGWYNFTVKDIITTKTNKVILQDWIYENSQRIDRKTFVDKLTSYKHNPTMPPGVMNYPEERLLEKKKAYEKRFDLLLEQY